MNAVRFSLKFSTMTLFMFSHFSHVKTSYSLTKDTQTSLSFEAKQQIRGKVLRVAVLHVKKL